MADLSPGGTEIPAPVDDETAAVLAKAMIAFPSVMVPSSPERSPAVPHGWHRSADRTRHGRPDKWRSVWPARPSRCRRGTGPGIFLWDRALRCQATGGETTTPGTLSSKTPSEIGRAQVLLSKCRQRTSQTLGPVAALCRHSSARCLLILKCSCDSAEGAFGVLSLPVGKCLPAHHGTPRQHAVNT